MRGRLLTGVIVALIAFVVAGVSVAKDRPFGAAKLIAMKWGPAPEEKDLGGGGGNTDPGGVLEGADRAVPLHQRGQPGRRGGHQLQHHRVQPGLEPRQRDRCRGRPDEPEPHRRGVQRLLLPVQQLAPAPARRSSRPASSPPSTAARPGSTGRSRCDPATARATRRRPSTAAHGVVLMAQLENPGGQGGAFVSQGDVSVSRSTDGGVNWSEPITVFKGKGAGIGPANQAVFYDKEWLTVDNNPGSPYYGRAYVTTRAVPQRPAGVYAESRRSGSATRTTAASPGQRPKEISGLASESAPSRRPAAGPTATRTSSPSPRSRPDGTCTCTSRTGRTRPPGRSTSTSTTRSWSTKSTDGGATLRRTCSDRPAGGRAQRHAVFGDRPPDGLGPPAPLDLGRQHLGQPAPPERRDRRLRRPRHGQPNATDGCINEIPGTAPAYDPCNAGPSSNTNVYLRRSTDGGATWTGRQVFDAAPATSGSRGPTTSRTAPSPSRGTRTSSPPAAPTPDQRPVRPRAAHLGRQADPRPAENTRRLGHPLGRPVRSRAGLADGVRPSRLHATPRRRRRGQGLQRVPRRLHRPRRRLARPGARRLDRPEPLRRVTQRDPYTGGPHDGYVQDAMYARR